MNNISERLSIVSEEGGFGEEGIFHSLRDHVHAVLFSSGTSGYFADSMAFYYQELKESLDEDDE